MRTATRTILILVVVMVGLATAGCASDPGSREYRPGHGWTPA
jgi:hypothetical protein